MALSAAARAFSLYFQLINILEQQIEEDELRRWMKEDVLARLGDGPAGVSGHVRVQREGDVLDLALETAPPDQPLPDQPDPDDLLAAMGKSHPRPPDE